MSDMVQIVARAIAHNQDDAEWDEIPKHKPDWIDKRGEAAGRHRDINEPFQSDYEEMACAAIRALVEPTEEMRATIEPALDRAYHGTKDCSVEAAGVQIYQTMLKAALGEED